MSDPRSSDPGGTTTLQSVPVDDGAWERFERRRDGARRGEPAAQLALGLLYLQGGSVPRDDALAARWVGRAAHLGCARAQFVLGVLVAVGCGVKRDDTGAVRWLRRAAAQGHVDALHLLGHLYEAGRGVPPDPVLAHFWWSLAAALGDGRARRQRDRLAGLMSLGQIARARALARFGAERVPGATAPTD